MTEKVPIEVTTHDIWFHIDSPVLSITNDGDYLITSGRDKAIRVWNMVYSPFTYSRDVYKRSQNSTIQFELVKELEEFSTGINCVRNNGNLLAACADGGKVIVYKNFRPTIIRNADDTHAIDLCWYDEYLFIGFATGRVEIYKIKVLEDILEEPKPKREKISLDTFTYDVLIETDGNNGEVKENINNVKENPEGIKEVIVDSNQNTDKVKKVIPIIIDQPKEIEYKLIFSKQIHDSEIKGISFNARYKCLATFSTELIVKVHLFENNKLVPISEIGKCDILDNKYTRFKRIHFDDNLLEIFGKGNKIYQFCYPFRESHKCKEIGPFNNPLTKIYKAEGKTFVLTCSNVYVYEGEEMICCVKDATYKQITDCFFYKNTLFVSSVDGFIATIRFKN